MARYDKINPKNGSYRASLAADLAPENVEKLLGVGHDAQGRLVIGAGQTGVVAVLILTKAYKAGYRCDPMQSGEIVEFGPTAGEPGIDFADPGKVYYSDAAGNIIAGSDEVQTITVTSSGSPFTVGVGDEDTAALSGSTTTGAQLQTALEGLPNVDVGDLTVTGAAGGPYVVTFGGKFADTNQPALSATNATVVETSAGGGTTGLVRVGFTVDNGQRLIVRVEH